MLFFFVFFLCLLHWLWNAMRCHMLYCRSFQLNILCFEALKNQYTWAKETAKWIHTELNRRNSSLFRKWNAVTIILLSYNWLHCDLANFYHSLFCHMSELTMNAIEVMVFYHFGVNDAHNVYHFVALGFFFLFWKMYSILVWLRCRRFF